jgi:hypothetical protein
MHPAITADVMAARHADLLREAEQARRVLAARRRNRSEPSRWRSRVGAILIALGETIEGRPTRGAWKLSQAQRRSG